MPKQTLLTLPPEALRERITETVHRHWVAPQITEAPFRVPESDVDCDKLSRAVLDCMLTRQFRVGPLPSPDIYERLLKRVRRQVASGQPILVTVGYAPLKNLNAVAYSRADWAEYFALCHLAAWHNKVCGVYAPGLRIRIAFDDTPLLMANCADRGAMKSYIDSIRSLVRALRFDKLIVGTMRHSRFSWVFHLGFYQIARRRVRRWEAEPANRAQLDEMDEFARRNVVLPAGLDPNEQDRRIRNASHLYRVYWEALQISRFWKSRRSLVAMYLDGTQHHIQQPVALHLTSLDKGQVTQPWQGEGALLDNGHGKLEPFVLTGGRRQRYQTQSVEGLEVVPAPGFDRILIAARDE